jgi:hypothetical protein
MSRLAGVCLMMAATCAAAADLTPCTRKAPALARDIPSQPVGQALDEFFRQTQLPYGSPPQLAASLKSRPVRAGAAPAKALRAMLQGTGLRLKCVKRLIAISVPPPPVEPRAPAPKLDDTLTEIVVTGRRNQREPPDTTAYSQADMEESGINGIDEIGLFTPGVEFDFFSTVGGGVYTNLAIRGVTDRHGNTAGVWYDDIPLPAVASNSFARGFPYTFDMAQVEVLRGPRPVLLGANAQGGARNPRGCCRPSWRPPPVATRPGRLPARPVARCWKTGWDSAPVAGIARKADSWIAWIHSLVRSWTRTPTA